LTSADSGCDSISITFHSAQEQLGDKRIFEAVQIASVFCRGRYL
jgi:hypothetical protein